MFSQSKVERERVHLSENSKGQKVISFFKKNIFVQFYAEFSYLFRQKVRTTTKYRIREIRSKVPKRVLARQDFPRFGDAKIGEEGVTLLSKEFVSMEHPDDQLVEDVDNPGIKNTLADFIKKNQERSLMREMGDNDYEQEDSAPTDKFGGGQETDPSTGRVKYVPPGARGGSGSGFGAGGFGAGGFGAGGDSDNANTLRVSNLTKSVSEDDLRDLFEPFGRVLRVSLPRVERTENGRTFKEPRGFAYISYMRKEDAEAALLRLQGHGYDHLILKLEWAKAPREGGGPPSGGGLSGGFVSGYGKQLAQDTQEKVYFASNLTGNR